MEITLTPIKQVFYNSENEYRVLSCVPTNWDAQVELNKYGNFTLSGYNLTNIILGQEICLNIIPDENSKYEASYVVEGYGGVSFTDEIKVDPKHEIILLQQLMTKDQAKNVNKAYPNFVELVLNNRENEIDPKNIYNVGGFRFTEYCNKIKENFGVFLFFSKTKSYNITDFSVVSKFYFAYQNPNNWEMFYKANPYDVLKNHTDWSFIKIDKTILSALPEFGTSIERAKYCVYDYLEQNEAEGDTRIDARILKEIIEEDYPELGSLIPSVIKTDEKIYFDSKNKYCGFKATYEAELNIANNILNRINHPISDTMDWVRFKNVDGYEMTDEQNQICQIANDKSIGMMIGCAGCVDAETEFFNGKQWKKISEYNSNDLVLQYNQGQGELVKPIAFIKRPCNTLYHFETKYGINQTVCEEHNIIYWSAKGKEHSCKIHDIIAKQTHENGWYGLFETSFCFNGTGINLTNAQIRVMCAVICDGTFNYQSNSNLCRIHLKKQRKKDRLELLLSQANIEYKKNISSAIDYVDYYFYSPIKTKVFDDYWYNCSNEQLQIICDEVLFWDGTINNTTNTIKKSFSTTKKENADFIQFAFSACGMRASIYISDRRGKTKIINNKTYIHKSIEYTITITNRHKVGLCTDNRPDHTKTNIEKIPTIDGYKYCFTVPSHKLILRRKNCIFVTGNCGKTTATKALIEMLDSYDKTYILLAPTGIAAKRLRESTKRPASTIHMALTRNDFSKEKFNYVIIDEMSCVGVYLLSAVFNNISEDTKVIFICDNAQLASISCGNIVEDIINSHIMPTTELTKIFRYGTSGIATIATNTREGKIDGRDTIFTENDYKCVDIDSKLPLEQIVEEYNNLLLEGYTRNDILILCPYNKSSLGTYTINEAIQKEYNTHEDGIVVEVKDKAVKQICYKVGDRVINIHNNYKAIVADINEQGVYTPTEKISPIMNGDIGVIRGIDFIEKNETNGLWTKYNIYVQFDEVMICFTPKEIKNLLLGYCISVHKSQGTQAKAIITVIGKNHKHLVTRNLLYVAVSRAQEKLIEIVNKDCIEQGLERVETIDRATWLGDLLTKS